MKLSYVGVDLAKNVFQLHGVDRHGQAVWRRRLRRGQWLQVLRETVEPGCIIGMEACSSAHHWARQLEAYGYDVRLVAPQFVKPFVKSNKNDRNDAEAICEAISRPHMRFVPVTDLSTSPTYDIDALVKSKAIDSSRAWNHGNRSTRRMNLGSKWDSSGNVPIPHNQ
jgi:transposase